MLQELTLTPLLPRPIQLFCLITLIFLARDIVHCASLVFLGQKTASIQYTVEEVVRARRFTARTSVYFNYEYVVGGQTYSGRDTPPLIGKRHGGPLTVYYSTLSPGFSTLQSPGWFCFECCLIWAPVLFVLTFLFRLRLKMAGQDLALPIKIMTWRPRSSRAVWALFQCTFALTIAYYSYISWKKSELWSLMIYMWGVGCVFFDVKNFLFQGASRMIALVSAGGFAIQAIVTLLNHDIYKTEITWHTWFYLAVLIPHILYVCLGPAVVPPQGSTLQT